MTPNVNGELNYLKFRDSSCVSERTEPMLSGDEHEECSQLPGTSCWSTIPQVGVHPCSPWPPSVGSSRRLSHGPWYRCLNCTVVQKISGPSSWSAHSYKFSPQTVFYSCPTLDFHWCSCVVRSPWADMEPLWQPTVSHYDVLTASSGGPHPLNHSGR